MTTAAGKLDFLMKLTSTQNAALGRALRYDASYISRIRSGKRKLPSKEDFLRPAAAWFAARIREEYQKAAAAGYMRLGRPWPEDEEAAAALLLAWLEGEDPGNDPAERMIAAMLSRRTKPELPDGGYDAREGNGTEAVLFYGDAGKRDGVAAFLGELCEGKSPRRLLLFSDEDMAWLYEDPAFTRSWARMMEKLVAGGCRVRIIHSISRDENEMWEAVRKWIPIYLSGSVEPWYYPRLRDGIFRRTLFVAEGRMALVSGSVRGQTGEELVVLLRDPAAAAALEREFSAYLDLCRPLLEIVRSENGGELTRVLRAFLSLPGELRTARLDGAVVCVREDSGALVVKTEAPVTLFSLTEPRMVAAMGEFLRRTPGETDPSEVLAELERLAAGGTD